MSASEIHLVRVTPDDRACQLWAAATARDGAVDRVLDAIPEGWTARLLEEAPERDAVLGMVSGDVRKLNQAPTSA